MNKTKKGGLGVNALFSQADNGIEPQKKNTPSTNLESPTLVASDSTKTQPEIKSQTSTQLMPSPSDEPAPRIKIRNTFVIYEDTMKTLEVLRLLAERKKIGTKESKVTYGDLIDEAVQTLVEHAYGEEDRKTLKEILSRSQ